MDRRSRPYGHPVGSWGMVGDTTVAPGTAQLVSRPVMSNHDCTATTTNRAMPTPP